MTTRENGFRVAGWVTTLIGAGWFLVAVAIVVAPALQLAPATPVGETVRVELSAGDHAVYMRPSGRWGSLSCTDDATGTTIQLRPDMTQQDLHLPERWYAQGSFKLTAARTIDLTCDSSITGAQFTVGPDVSFFHVAGFALVGAASVVTTLTGVAFLMISRRSRRRRLSLAGQPRTRRE